LQQFERVGKDEHFPLVLARLCEQLPFDFGFHLRLLFLRCVRNLDEVVALKEQFEVDLES
jgi:hypothetical protein